MGRFERNMRVCLWDKWVKISNKQLNIQAWNSKETIWVQDTDLEQCTYKWKYKSEGSWGHLGGGFKGMCRRKGGLNLKD